MAVFIYLGVTVNSQSPKNPTNEFFIIEMAIILKLQIHLGECLVAALFSSSLVPCQVSSTRSCVIKRVAIVQIILVSTAEDDTISSFLLTTVNASNWWTKTNESDVKRTHTCPSGCDRSSIRTGSMH